MCPDQASWCIITMLLPTIELLGQVAILIGVGLKIRLSDQTKGLIPELYFFFFFSLLQLAFIFFYFFIFKLNIFG